MTNDAPKLQPYQQQLLTAITEGQVFMVSNPSMGGKSVFLQQLRNNRDLFWHGEPIGRVVDITIDFSTRLESMAAVTELAREALGEALGRMTVSGTFTTYFDDMRFRENWLNGRWPRYRMLRGWRRHERKRKAKRCA